MTAEKVNILSVALDEPLDEAGFRHVATTVGERLGARRIGASVTGDWLIRNRPGRDGVSVRETGGLTS